MHIIDFHTHVFPDAVAPSAMHALLKDSEGRFDAQYDGTVDGLVGLMDRCGIAISVTQPVATRASQVSSINDWAAALENDRIVPFGAMHPDFDEPDAEIARMRRMGLLGFKMHPEHQAFEPHEERLERIWDAAIRHEMTVLFHAGADVIHPGIRGTAESFARLIDEWPDLTCILAHLGGFRQWESVSEHLRGRDVWLDTAYTMGHLPDEEFVALVRAHGVDRVLFGSDGPWTNPAAEIAYMSRLGFSDDELAAILGGNAERLLGR